MSAGMAVAADDRHSRLRNPEFRTNHVHDPLFGRIHIEQPDSEFLAVCLQCRNLLAAIRSVIGVPRGSVGMLWSTVATVRDGCRTFRPAARSPSNA